MSFVTRKWCQKCNKRWKTELKRPKFRAARALTDLSTICVMILLLFEAKIAAKRRFFLNLFLGFLNTVCFKFPSAEHAVYRCNSCLTGFHVIHVKNCMETAKKIPKKSQKIHKENSHQNPEKVLKSHIMLSKNSKFHIKKYPTKILKKYWNPILCCHNV